MRLRRLIALVALALVAVAGVALAAGGGAAKVTLCAAGDGSLSAPKSGKCSKGERKLKVATKGPRGPNGRAGTAGPNGAPGAGGPAPNFSAPFTALGAAGPDCVTTFVFCSTSGGYWSNYGNEYAPVGYRTDAMGFVHLQGMAQANGSGTVTILYLPPGLRPPDFMTLPTRGCAGDWQRIYIYADGKVDTTNLACTPLDGISFHP